MHHVHLYNQNDKSSQAIFLHLRKSLSDSKETYQINLKKKKGLIHFQLLRKFLFYSGLLTGFKIINGSLFCVEGDDNEITTRDFSRRENFFRHKFVIRVN